MNTQVFVPFLNEDRRCAVDLREGAEDLSGGGADGAREAALVAHVEAREAPEQRAVEDVALGRQGRPLVALLAAHATEGSWVEGRVVGQRVHQNELHVRLFQQASKRSVGRSVSQSV